MEASAEKPDQVEGGLVQEVLRVCPQALRQPVGEPEFPTFSFEGRVAWCSDVWRLCEFRMIAAAFLEKPPAGLLADPESREAPAQHT